MTNKENFLALVSNDKTDTLERNRKRIKNRAMLRESQQIAIKVLIKLARTMLCRKKNLRKKWKFLHNKLQKL